MANQSVTIKDVAKAAGVSITTVSRYLNKRYDSMSTQTKDRIEQVIVELNYQPNKMAQGLKGQSRTVAVVVVNLGYPYAVAVIRSLSSALHQAGYALLVGESGGNPNQEAQLLHSFIAQGVDSIIVQTGGENNDMLQQLAAERPVILIDRQFEVTDVVNVITDNQQASSRLTQRLLEEGYQSVVYVSEEPSGLSTRVLRLEGYVSACRAARLEPDIRYVDRDNHSSIATLIQSLMERAPKKPFAVYTANGLVMLDLYPKLRALPYSVPTDMGLATFDEPDWVQVTNPRLTCVRQPTDEIGLAAAEAVLTQLGVTETPLKHPGARGQVGGTRSQDTGARGRVTGTRDQDTGTRVIPSEIIWGESTRLQ